MGHLVTGLIARPSVLEAFSREHSLHWPIALAGGLAILPLREIDLDSLQATPSDRAAAGLQHLSKRLVDELRRSSHQGPLIYFLKPNISAAWVGKVRQYSRMAN